MKKLEINKDLYDIVQGKTVALIGPAGYLQGKNLHKHLDDYDVVCRPNEIIPLKQQRLDYGNRTDIMFCNFGTQWMPGIKRKIESEDRREYFKNLKLVVCSATKASHQDVDFLNWPDNHVSQVVHNFQDINEYDLPFYWIGVRDYNRIYAEIGVEFHTGMASIVTLLNYPIKELLITGFSFYTGGERYEDLYCPGHMDKADTDGRTFGHGSHAAMVQLSYFKRLLSLNSCIKIDPYMNTMLDLNHDNLLDCGVG